jgi:O-antigen ligase
MSRFKQSPARPGFSPLASPESARPPADSSSVSTLPPPAPARGNPSSPFFAPAPRIAGPAQPPDNMFQNVGFWFAVAYVFVRFSFLSEIVGVKFGVRPLFPYLTVPIALIAVCLSGGIVRVVRYRNGKLLLGYFAWLLIAAPFSVWKGGTFATLYDAFTANFTIFFIIAGLTVTWKQCRVMIAAGALGALVLAAISRTDGIYMQGRYSLPWGSLENPNDLATHLMMGIPLCLAMFVLSSRFSFWKIAAVIGVPVMAYLILITGSRAGFLSFLLVAAILVARAPMGLKIVVGGLLVVTVPAAIALLPSSARLRYTTILSNDAADSQLNDTADQYTYGAAVGSENARRALLMNSISATFRNPIFGVGSGEFAVEQSGEAQRAGQRAAWQVTHNSFTQTSSESGIPGFLFFTGSLVASMTMLFRTWKRTRRDPAYRQLSAVAGCLILLGVGMTVNLFFTALAYFYYVPWFTAMAIVVTSLAPQPSRMFASRTPAMPPTASL